MNKKIICLSIILALTSYGLIKSFDSMIPRSEPLVLNVDHRVPELNRFMDKQLCPKPYYVKEYLNAADKYNLDYRLLPAISVQESSCGRHACGDGIRRWGFGSCKGYTFKSVAEGIDYVSNQLENGSYYRGKSLIGKLKAYNSVNPLYYREIVNLMEKMGNLKPYQIKI